MDEKEHGYLDHTFFGTARQAIGGRVAWLGWTLGVVLVLVGLVGGVAGWPLIVPGVVILLGMSLGAVRRSRERREDREIAKLPALDLPHAAAPHDEIRIHIDVPEHSDPDPPEHA
jgi:Flp pilus assembly protein TadB